jgi:hypothetical protein
MSNSQEKGEEFKRIDAVLRQHASGRHPSDHISLDHHDHEGSKDHHANPGKHDADTAHNENKSWGEILEKAGKRALGGGLAGAVAMFAQVGSLMWMRTTMNYQYRNGGTTGNAFRTLYKEGGIGRFYKVNCLFALFEPCLAPLSHTHTHSRIIIMYFLIYFLNFLTSGCWTSFGSRSIITFW